MEQYIKDKMNLVYKDGNYEKYILSENPRSISVILNSEDITAIFSFTKPGFIIAKEYYDNPSISEFKEMVIKFKKTDEQLLNDEFGGDFLNVK